MSKEALQPGQQLDAYTIDSPLGKGGMAEVYQATHLALERTVAIKVLNPGLSVDPTFPLRFLREAKTVAKLNHPNIVTVYDFNNKGDTAYLVMELASGGTLRDRAKEFRTLFEAVQGLAPVCEALQFAHERGVIHRDVKSNNVLINDRGEPLLADFGLARMVEESLDFTLLGSSAGSPHYMAPEQALGEDVDHRADIYALGIVAYEVIGGKLPYTGKSVVAVMQQHVSAGPPSIQDVLPEAPARLEAAIRKATAKRPEERFQSAREFLAELRAAAAEAPELPVRAGRPAAAAAAATPATSSASSGAGVVSPAAWTRPTGGPPASTQGSPADTSSAMSTALPAGIGPPTGQLATEEDEIGDATVVESAVVFPLMEPELSDATVVEPATTAGQPEDQVESPQPEMEPLPPLPARRRSRPSSFAGIHWGTIVGVAAVLLTIDGLCLWAALAGPAAPTAAAGLFRHLAATRNILALAALLLGILNATLMRVAVLADYHLSAKTYQRLRQNHRFVGYTTAFMAIAVQLLTWIQIGALGMGTARAVLNLVFGTMLLLLAVFKVAVVRYIASLRVYLPWLGIGLAVLLLIVLALNTVPLAWGVS